ncbi:MAG: glycosyltransferase family 1 protein [Planctomycetota bacterium]
MNISLDVSSAARAESTGVAMYIRRMVAAFARVGGAHQFSLVTRASRLKNIFRLPELPAPNFRSKLMLEGLHPFFARSQHVFHGLDARLPGRWMKAKTVVTIHDVYSSLQSTEFATADFRAMKTKRYAELVERADRIICISHAVKRDVIATLNPDPAKLRVVYEAGGEGFAPRPVNVVSTVRKKYALDRPYFIFVGSINKRKNILAQARAFLSARRAAKSDALLAIAGRVGFGGDEIRALIEKEEGGSAIKILGYVPDADIPALYSGARALLFATLYEGFGIPAIEAFACGCPVIGATTGSLPEIIGDAGLLADPCSETSIAEQIQTMLSDDVLHATFVAKGIERAKLFSWDKAARECLDVYVEMV